MRAAQPARPVRPTLLPSYVDVLKYTGSSVNVCHACCHCRGCARQVRSGLSTDSSNTTLSRCTLFEDSHSTLAVHIFRAFQTVRVAGAVLKRSCPVSVICFWPCGRCQPCMSKISCTHSRHHLQDGLSSYTHCTFREDLSYASSGTLVY